MGIVQRLRADWVFSIGIARTLAGIIPLARQPARTAATEGNAVMFNLKGTAGPLADARSGLRPIFPMINIRIRPEFDHETVERAAAGFCVRCAPCEVGELISQIVFDPLKPGFDPGRVADPLYFDHPGAGCSVRLGADLHEQILTGALRL